MMDYIVNYNVSNVNIHCVIQEKDAIIGRQQKEIEDLHKTNQLLAKDIDKLKADLDLQKKCFEALEKFKYSLERNVSVLKDYDKNRWSISDAESEVKIWEHEFLMIRKMLDKREREETQALLMANNVLNADLMNNSQPNAQLLPKQSSHRRSAPKPKIIEMSEDGTALKRYACDYPNCTYRSNWAHDLKGHKRKHTGEKPYTCAWINCQKSFRDLRDLKRHQRAHTGDKRYSCDWPGCDYRSTDVANLAKHKRTHTGEKPYRCDWNGCEASFADGSHLRRHQKKHENQVTKLSKTSSTKKRQSNPKTTSIVKTRQQPGRKAKGLRALISLDLKQDVNEENNSGVKSISLNESNVENNDNLNQNQENNGMNNKTDLMEESNRTEDANRSESIETIVPNLIPESNINSIDSHVLSEPIDGNSSLIQQINTNSDIISNTIEERNTSDVSSGHTDGENPSIMKLNLVNDNRLVVFKNPIVITSTMIEDNDRTVNTSDLQESEDKQSVVRYTNI